MFFKLKLKKKIVTLKFKIQFFIYEPFILNCIKKIYTCIRIDFFRFVIFV